LHRRRSAGRSRRQRLREIPARRTGSRSPAGLLGGARQRTMSARGPQQERSRATRQRLIEAAVECLGEFGWNRTTVSVIAGRAGVSRGAAQHHFPTREDLVVAAVEHMATQQVEELRDRAARLPHGPDRAERIATMLLELYTGPMFRAALHLWVAAA